MDDAIIEYFRKNWLTEYWRGKHARAFSCEFTLLTFHVSDLWADSGLPAGTSRDGILNTNNWIESAFRTFKLVFLGNRNNKR